MTKDVIALTQQMPDPLSILAGLLAGGPDNLVQAAGEGAVVQLCDEQGRPLVSVEAPLLVQVPGEATRLLGAQEPATPYWWTEARATTGVAEAEQLAAAYVSRIASLVGGAVWPPEAARELGVVKSEGVHATSDAAGGAVDVLTDKAAVVIQDRPVVPMTAWLSTAVGAAAAAGIGLQIVTPPGARLTPAVRAALDGWPSRWVVRDEECGYYDGLSGAVLAWQGGMFQPVPGEDGQTPVPEVFKDVTDTGERQLTLQFRTIHPADDRLVLGGALEAVCQALRGAPPAGWGTAEPVNLPWSLRQLTDLAYERAPEPTLLYAVGDALFATVRVSRTKAGVEEDITVVAGYGADEEPPLDKVPAIAETLATRHHLQSLLVQIRKARRDLAVPPHFEAPAVPAGFALGADEVRAMPGDRARRTPLAAAPVELGPATRPALYYPLPGDPSDLAGWTDFEKLMRHLKGA
ncbi:hypothetical protein H9Y04_27775 [Streptomyces sp. TRM66268-LWL]|uniref:Uncharacterized protein n=1 Tax=Streptomyces polyasparticus TaxID=2767826 RepID=A0ABR7SLI4_9ACTN|nr:DUF6177 family protein [Streptomyces polyasparticus]MBC9716341.1 hypothetical protein [Streptomyces polyasparticus]